LVQETPVTEFRETGLPRGNRISTSMVSGNDLKGPNASESLTFMNRFEAFQRVTRQLVRYSSSPSNGGASGS
jgi:hypothetical protein